MKRIREAYRRPRGRGGDGPPNTVGAKAFVAAFLLLAASVDSSRAAAHVEPPSEQIERLVIHLKSEGRPPAEYVISKFRDRRVVLLGENHWVRQDVTLVRDLVALLPEAGVKFLAMEVLPASEQERIDRIVTASNWDRHEAVTVMRKAAWPYEEYLELMHAVWKENVARPSSEAISIIALGPGSDWRDRLLPKGQTYDSFMAEVVLGRMKNKSARALIYCGAHHTFTRYYQPEFPPAERVERFMERMGNILWRNLGDDVFLITLHRPWSLIQKGESIRSYPVHGIVDCAASKIGKPLGFDIVQSPFAQLDSQPGTYYAAGHPGFRFQDITDGYIWQAPLGAYEGVQLIALEEFAPDAESAAEVVSNNPLSDKPGMTFVELKELWRQEHAELSRFPERWKELLREGPCP